MTRAVVSLPRRTRYAGCELDVVESVYDIATEDLLIAFDVSCCSGLVVKEFSAFFHNPADGLIFLSGLPLVKLDGFIVSPAQSVGAVMLEAEAIS